MVDRERLIKELTRKFRNRARRSHAKREESLRGAVNKSAEENSGMATEAVSADGEAGNRSAEIGKE
jgi:hypothetical protein